MTDVSSIKIIGLEEHFVTTDVMTACQLLELQWQERGAQAVGRRESGRRLFDLTADRIAAMDETGPDIEVLSLTARRNP